MPAGEHVALMPERNAGCNFAGYDTKHAITLPTLMYDRGDESGGDYNGKKGVLQVELLVLAKILRRLFSRYKYNISPHNREFFCRMMQTSDLNHNPMHSSQLRKKRQILPFSHPLDGQSNYKLLCLPEGLRNTLLYECPIHRMKDSINNNKSPAIEVSSSDIEPNCVRWAVPEFPLRNSNEMDSFPETTKSPSISMLARDTLPDH